MALSHGFRSGSEGRSRNLKYPIFTLILSGEVGQACGKLNGLHMKLEYNTKRRISAAKDIDLFLCFSQEQNTLNGAVTVAREEEQVTHYSEVGSSIPIFLSLYVEVS